MAGHARLLEQQATLAEFGRLALQSQDLDAILREACSLVADCLDVAIAKILEVSGDGFLLRASVGIPAEVAVDGQTRVPSGTESAAGLALLTGKPVISDLASETRFARSELARRSGARFSANVIIAGEQETYGVLEIDSIDERAFSNDDVSFLQNYANLLAAAVDRHQAAQRLAAMAHERETLLRELQHRIKNDLQVVTSLLVLGEGQAPSPEARAHLESIRSRVETLRLLHARMFGASRVGAVELAPYVEEIASGRLHMHGAAAADAGVALEPDLDPVTVDHDRAVLIGLIVNEFITNSLKHAFPDGRGTVTIRLKAAPEGALRLSLRDNGIGFRAAQRPHPQGFGTRLIEQLARQLGAEPEWRTDDGTSLELGFPR